MREPVGGERGFTLIEVMVAIILLTFGLLAVAGVFPQGLAMGLYGKDQTRSASLAQQEMECIIYQYGAGNLALGGSTGIVGDYGSTRSSTPTVCNPNSTATLTAYLTQDGAQTTQASAYFTRDVQVQYWTWNSSTSQFVLPGSPFTCPTGDTCPPTGPEPTPYIYRVSVATHWMLRGATAYKSGQTTNGCVSGGNAVPAAVGCMQTSMFIRP